MWYRISAISRIFKSARRLKLRGGTSVHYIPLINALSLVFPRCRERRCFPRAPSRLRESRTNEWVNECRDKKKKQKSQRIYWKSRKILEVKEKGAKKDIAKGLFSLIRVSRVPVFEFLDRIEPSRLLDLRGTSIIGIETTRQKNTVRVLAMLNEVFRLTTVQKNQEYSW